MNQKLKRTIAYFGLAVVSVICPEIAHGMVGAKIPWTTYQAEDMQTDGEVLGPKYTAHLVETESSGEKCVRLPRQNAYIEFNAAAEANAMVVRYSLPDSPDGKGVDSSLLLSINGKEVQTLSISSHYSHLYGKYPFSNQPGDGQERNFYDEVRVRDLHIGKGDRIRLSNKSGESIPCIIDLVDLENVPAPLAAPKDGLSVLDFGATGKGVADDTAALKACLAEAIKRGKTVWVPAGEYKLTGDILLPSSASIQGAGLWYTTFVGDAALYSQSDRRVRFKLKGNNIRLADFAIVGRLNYRNDEEPNDGIVGAGCTDCNITRIWIEHTKTCAWIYNGTGLHIEGCRFRNSIADGVNLCVGANGNIVEDCTARGTGDDCFAVWPTASDQSYVQVARPGNNIIRHCTAEVPFLANGAAIYGGYNNTVESCRFTDITVGCGVLISSTFPTSDEARKIDNNFSGTTVVRDCELLRCGGDDHDWSWRAALQLCLDRRSISGVSISHVTIMDSLSDGLSIVAPGSKKGEGTLSDTRLDHVSIDRFGLATPNRHALWVRDDVAGNLALVDSALADVKNDSAHFTIRQSSN